MSTALVTAIKADKPACLKIDRYRPSAMKIGVTTASDKTTATHWLLFRVIQLSERRHSANQTANTHSAMSTQSAISRFAARGKAKSSVEILLVMNVQRNK